MNELGLPRDVDALIALVLVERADRDRERAQHQASLAQRDEKLVALEHMLALYEKWQWGPARVK